MPKKSFKWSLEAQMDLSRLRKQQIQKGYVNWKQIAQYINLKYEWCSRTPKQCREKYINFCNFHQNKFINNDWTQEQILLLKQNYIQYGPSWVFLSHKFKRSQNSIKNFFNILLKRAAKALSFYETKTLLRQNSVLITPQNLMRIMEFINKLRKTFRDQRYKLNYQCDLLTNWLKILNYVFLLNQVSGQVTHDVIKSVKTINRRLGSFKLFNRKCKIKKNWTFTENNIKSFIQHDQVIITQPIKLNQTQGGQVKYEEEYNNYQKQQFDMEMNIGINPIFSWLNIDYNPEIQVKQQLKKQEEYVSVLNFI